MTSWKIVWDKRFGLLCLIFIFYKIKQRKKNFYGCVSRDGGHWSKFAGANEATKEATENQAPSILTINFNTSSLINICRYTAKNVNRKTAKWRIPRQISMRTKIFTNSHHCNHNWPYSQTKCFWSRKFMNVTQILIVFFIFQFNQFVANMVFVSSKGELVFFKLDSLFLKTLKHWNWNTKTQMKIGQK